MEEKMKYLSIIMLGCGLVLCSCDIFTPEYDVVWKLKADEHLDTSPAIADDGTIYICSHSYLYAIDPQGKIKWEYDTEDQAITSPAIGSDGTIYFTSAYLHAVNPGGSSKWRTEVNGGTWYGCPAIGPDGTIYCNGTQRIYAVGNDGEIKWEFENASDPVVESDGTIYVELYDSGGYALAALNVEGELLWSYPVGHQREGEPVIDSDGTVYFGTHAYDDGEEGGDTASFYAIAADGNLKWEYRMRGGFLGAPAIGPDGIIYVGASQVYERGVEHSIDTSFFIAFTPDGEIEWKQPYDFYWISTPAIGSDGVVYFASQFDGFYAINPDGSEQWYSKNYGSNFSSPAIGSDGIIYFVSGGKLFALKGSSDGLASSPWPRYHHDNQNTGRAGG